jgi:hypothetical protein
MGVLCLPRTIPDRGKMNRRERRERRERYEIDV